MTKIATRVRRTVRRTKWRVTPTFLKLRRFRKERNEAERRYDLAQNGRQEHDALFDLTGIRLQINEIHTKKLRRQAERLDLTLPVWNDYEAWEEDSEADPRVDGRVLTKKGIYDLRKRIRDERKERRQVYKDWATIIVGVLGALIGLFSVIF